MKAQSVQIKFLTVFTVMAMLLFFAAPSARAQAQENIANLPANTSTTQGNVPAVDDNITNDDTHDPPSRVARISVVEGSVSMQPGGTGDWGAAQKNRPVTIGDKIWVDNDSRAELQAGQVALHLGGMTALSFLNLDQNVTQIRLPEGKLNFRVREIRQGENYEIDTPNMSFTVKEAGAFRIDVNENGDFTGVTVIRGAGEIAASGQVYEVKAGEHYDVSGAEGTVNVASAPAVEADNLDKWAQQRDTTEDNSASSRYVNRDVVGYSDLDDYGTWKQDPQYGNVWTPNNVSPDWAPYSNGYWSYVGPWGWTWVDYAPWGFAPFHYGRWVYGGGSWGWAPGPVWAYPYYGPAFVGFLGGFGFGVGFGWGWGHAWFPLGWGEPFHPWYHAGIGYWRNINVHNTFIRNFNGNPGGYRNFNYAYAHNVHAVTSASHEAFTRGQAINRSSQHLTESSLRSAQVTNRINESPSRTSALGAANARSNVARPSNGIANRNVMARTAPASGASHFSMNNAGAARTNSSLSARNNVNSNINSNRMSQLNANRPPSAQAGNTARANGASVNGANRSGNAGRSWNAQGNVTDSGRAPQGFGSSNRPSNTTAGANRSDRPPNAGNMRTNGASRNSSYRPPASYNNGRSYSAPSYNSNRPSYNGGNRGYSAPRSYGNSGSSRSYSAPRSNSAPRSYSGGGGSHSSGGGGGGHASSGGGGHSGGGGGHSGGGHR
jgi:hypothetical protein